MGRDTYIEETCILFKQNYIFLLHLPSSLPVPWAFIPPALWDYVLRRNWHKGSAPQLFSLAVPALNWRAGLGWSSLYTWSLYGFYLLEKFSPLAGYREGLQLRQSWDFILSFLGFLLSFFFFFNITKRTNWYFPNAWSFLLLFIFKICFLEVHTIHMRINLLGFTV